MAIPKTPKPTGQLNSWEADLAKSAAIAVKAESRLVDRPFISMAQQMTIGGAPVPNNTLPVIVLAGLHTNLFYEGDYDAANPVAPTCYAYSTENELGEIVGVDTWNGGKEVAPNKACTTRCADSCADCPNNQWASANKGRGKACQNVRRLAMIPAGTFVNGQFQPYTKPEQITDAPVAYLKLAIMSVKGFSNYVSQTATALSRPLWGVFSRLTRVPDSRTQYIAQFEALSLVPNALMDAVHKRYLAATADIAFPFQTQTKTAPPVDFKPRPKLRKYS